MFWHRCRSLCDVLWAATPSPLGAIGHADHRNTAGAVSDSCLGGASITLVARSGGLDTGISLCLRAAL